MSGSATPIPDAIQTSQSNKEVTANDGLQAMSPAALYGRHDAATSGLTWGYYGGSVNIGGTLTQVANGTLLLTASLVNYVEVDASGTVSANTVGFTAGRVALYAVTCGASTITSYVDWRIGLAILALAAGANFASGEIPTGLINGANTTYTLTHSPVAGSLSYFANGMYQVPTVDYTITGNTITRTTALITGDTHAVASYRY